jgi:hypothetical protein
MKKKDFMIICILYVLVGIAYLILLFMFMWILKITIDAGEIGRTLFISFTISWYVFGLIYFTIKIIKLFKKLKLKENKE